MKGDTRTSSRRSTGERQACRSTTRSSRKSTYARAAEEVHNGYFSIDKKGGWTDTEENNQANRDNAERAYNLIMKEKEKLLSFETPLEVYLLPLCIAGGLGQPQHLPDLHAARHPYRARAPADHRTWSAPVCKPEKANDCVASRSTRSRSSPLESYEQFAENLQKEIEEDTGIRFGIVETHQFAAVTVMDADGNTTPLGFEQSKVLWDHLKAEGHIDARGKVQDSLRRPSEDGTFTVPEVFAPAARTDLTRAAQAGWAA